MKDGAYFRAVLVELIGSRPYVSFSVSRDDVSRCEFSNSLVRGCIDFSMSVHSQYTSEYQVPLSMYDMTEKER